MDGRDLSKVQVPAYYPDNPTIRGDLADYAIEVEWYDRHIGLALRQLEQRNLLEDTVIIATSDHGMPFPRVKGQIYDDGFHVPLAVRWGSQILPKRTVTDFVSFPDVAPTLMDIAGIPIHPQMTGKSFKKQLLSAKSGRIDLERDHALLGKERHDIGRTDGDRLSVSYPSRAIRTDRYLFVYNFKPNRWPGGDPQYGLLNCDSSPTKTYLQSILKSDTEYRFYEMSFGKRPQEELFDVVNDPDCINNLADDPQHQKIKNRLWNQLKQELTSQEDPRILGNGDIFDFYPNCRIEKQQELYNKPKYNPVKIFNSKYGSGKK